MVSVVARYEGSQIGNSTDTISTVICRWGYVVHSFFSAFRYSIDLDPIIFSVDGKMHNFSQCLQAGYTGIACIYATTPEQCVYVRAVILYL